MNTIKILLAIFATNMTISNAQSLTDMIKDNEALTEAYWSFVKSEYAYYDGRQAKLRTDHYKGGQWAKEDLEKALASFEANEFRDGKFPLDTFQEKYIDGESFQKKFDTEFNAQMKARAGQESDRLKRIKIESDFKNEYQMLSCHYFSFKQKVDKYGDFKKELAEEMYNDALLYEQKIGEYNKEVIHEEMKKILSFALRLDPEHAQAKSKLSAL